MSLSARSSSGSWSAGGGGAAPDIIDLDKFMRGAVRPSRPDSHNLRTTCAKLVVDAGGVDRKPVSATLGVGGGGAGGSGGAGGRVAPPSLSAASSSTVSRPPPHNKRFSHDSGLSDGSYARRKHRQHRRAPGGDNSGVRAPKTPAGGSSNSLRAFRTVCERALLDQQAQIARVAQLCERLTERAPRRAERSATDTSDVSSSSRSTRDQRLKDKHRTEECKTYKIIMNKLDELNRLFAARARSPSGAAGRARARSPAGAAGAAGIARARSPAPLAARCASRSSGSVSVSDKVVATEPEHRTQLQVNHNTVTVVRGGGGSLGGRGSVSGAGAGGAGAGRAGGSRRGQLRAVANACALDIAPLPPPHRHNVATESVFQCESGAGTGSCGDPRCGFDLEDPVHLYSQAKRLQTLPASTRRARSVERSRELLERLDERGGARPGAPSPRETHTTLCALCRGYWRALRHYVAAQIFCVPDAGAACH